MSKWGESTMQHILPWLKQGAGHFSRPALAFVDARPAVRPASAQATGSPSSEAGEHQWSTCCLPAFRPAPPLTQCVSTTLCSHHRHHPLLTINLKLSLTPALTSEPDPHCNHKHILSLHLIEHLNINPSTVPWI